MNKKNKINIFIVEDNKVFTLALKADIETAFLNMSIQIHSFETGESCMEKFKEEKPNVVILDYNLNSMNPNAANGIAILDWIKKENHETNVIMLTSEDNLEIALRSFKHGASDYVVKSETKFRKINYSLFNLFKIMEAKTDAKKYKSLAIGLSLCIAVLIGGIIAIQIFNPSLLK
jgi:two-component system OmpR family response regulator